MKQAGLWLTAALLTIAAAGLLLRFSGLIHWGDRLQPQIAAVVPAPLSGPVPAACQTGNPASESPASGLPPVPHLVRVPRNYTADRLWPLVIVLPPAGMSSGMVERHAGLTASLTARGYVIAYVGAMGRLSMEGLKRYRSLPQWLAQQYCVASDRAIWMGHSNGATAALALALGKVGAVAVEGLVLSGTGWNDESFAGEQCPAPVNVLVLHGTNDRRFPGYGRQSIEWLAACHQCSPNPTKTPDGCLEWQSCLALTRYCETETGHWTWAGELDQLVNWMQSPAPQVPD